MHRIKKVIIKWLGGITRQEYDYVCSELEKAKEDRDVYKQISDSAYNYLGSYPVWKSQQEFRDMLHTIGRPLTPIDIAKADNQSYSKAQAIDCYLGKLVDTFFLLKTRLPISHDVNRSEAFKTHEALEIARGSRYLAKKSLEII